MFPKTTFADDSDQSISEEEDLAPDWPESCIPLGETAELKVQGRIRIQSQLEVLRDSLETPNGTKATNLLTKAQTGLSSEDEVEVPFFQDDGDFTSSLGMASLLNFNQGIISNDGRFGFQKLGSQKPDEACTWSAINREAEVLVSLTENAWSSMHSGSSYAKKPHKGNRGKAKPKLSFRFLSHRGDTSSAVGSKTEVNMSSSVFPLLEKLKGVNRSADENLMGEPLMEKDMVKQLDNCGVQTDPRFGCGYTRSMIDLLDSFQDKNGVTMENTEMMDDEGSISPFGERKLNYEEHPEAFNNGSSSDDEPYLPMNVHNLGLVVPSSEQKTMTDKFEEVFGFVTANEKRPDIASHGIELFGKLQQVMQSEKEREMEFLKRMQTSCNSIDETSSIDVEILSRCLEAKLIVCHCSLIQDKEHSHGAEYSHAMNENQRRAMTIIFSLRVCDDVELEVGNLIRIYSPWKEVQVGERDEIIVLSMFFSQI